MEIWHAIVLGLVEGLTEYLPVSSTGHLLVAQRLMGIPQNHASNAYAVAIQAGAIVAVALLYRQRLSWMASGLIGRDPAGARLLVCVVLAFVPAAVAGFAFDDLLESYLFSPLPIAAAWAAGGVLMIAISYRLVPGRIQLEAISVRTALVVGVCQCAALWPGVSRSLATIVAGIVLGLSLTAAVEFSFLLGLLTLTAASSYTLLQSGGVMLQAYGVAELATGFLTAWVAAMLSVYWMVRWLERRSLVIFGWWRLIAAAAVLCLVLSQKI